MVVLEAMMLTSGGLATARFYAERRSCMDCMGLVTYFARTRKNPVTCLHHAFLDRLDTEPDLRHLKFRVGGLVGPHVIFPYAEDLVAHIASSKKYRRTNPLDSANSCIAGCITSPWVTGMKPFLEEFLESSIWFKPAGPVHKRQRDLFTAFVGKFHDQKIQDEIHCLAKKSLRERIEVNGAKIASSDLFDLLQEVVAIVQLRFISDFELGSSMTIREYCDLTNSSFGGMYAFHSPSREETQKLAGLCNDMLRRGGKNGFVHYIRQHAPKKMTKEQLEKELRHNLMASLFLGQQSLANGAFWVIVRLAQEPELLKEIRHNRSTLPEVIAEELRIHPPSSPFLMPYLALKGDEYKGLQIGAGDRVVVMPSLVQLNKKEWPNPMQFEKDRLSDIISKKHKERDTSCSWDGGPAPVSVLHAQMKIQETRTCPVSGDTGTTCPKSNHVGSQKYSSFGVGNATCPMQGFSIGVLNNLLSIVVEEWNVEVDGMTPTFMSTPVIEHVNVDTGSRPWRRVKATFNPRR